MTTESLTVNMKTTIGLIISFIVFLVVGSLGTLLIGEWDIYIAVSLAIFVPILSVLLSFCLKRRAWAYVGTIALGIFFVVAAPLSLVGEIPPLIMWETVLATVLGLLMALEGFKAYTELKQRR